MKDKWNPGIVFLCITPKPGERSFMSRHQCWNTELFIKSQREAYALDGGVVAVITEAQYQEGK